jgi:hypothetical protein
VLLYHKCDTPLYHKQWYLRREGAQLRTLIPGKMGILKSHSTGK